MLNWGCNCVDGESAEQAITLLGNKTLDILLVDYRLRGGSTGREAINDIRQHVGKNIPAIIITGDTSADRILEAQAVNALLLHKPASTAQLQRMMHKLLR
jgi:CheY-like chemotaxis protein